MGNRRRGRVAFPRALRFPGERDWRCQRCSGRSRGDAECSTEATVSHGRAVRRGRPWDPAGRATPAEQACAYSESIRGRHRDVGTAVEQIINRPSESCGPLYGNGHIADGRSPALSHDALDELAAARHRADALERVERGEVTDEELIRHAELARQRLDEVIVEMETTGEDQSDELVQSGTAGVRVETGTGPK